MTELLTVWAGQSKAKEVLDESTGIYAAALHWYMYKQIMVTDHNNVFSVSTVHKK